MISTQVITTTICALFFASPNESLSDSQCRSAKRWGMGSFSLQGKHFSHASYGWQHFNVYLGWPTVCHERQQSAEKLYTLINAALSTGGEVVREISFGGDQLE